MKALLPVTLALLAGTTHAAGDATAGEAAFQELCMDCHTLVPGPQKRGPALQGVIGRPAGKFPNFHYSDAMLAAGFTWTPERLAEFLADPKGKLPGTKMRLLEPATAKQIEDVIAYLQRAG